jgi:hypothetical protein
MRQTLILAPLLALGLTACERLGIEDPAKVAAAKEAEGKAVGAGCRHAGRSLEDCYAQNPKALKAAVFAGWREMNDYMAQNKIEVTAPAAGGAAAQSDAGHGPAEPARKGNDGRAADKPSGAEHKPGVASAARKPVEPGDRLAEKH